MPIIIEGFFALLSNVLLFTSRLDSGNSFPHPLSPEKEKYYLERARQGDKDARDILIRHNLRLVVFIAKKYTNYPDQDELISVGTLGLMKAIKTYSEGKGTQLATYASRCIENEILMTMRSRKKLQSNVSLYENIGSDKDGNQLALIDVLCEDEESVYQNLENRLFIKLQPWAREAIVSGLEGGVGYQHLSYYKFSPEMLMSGNRNVKENNLYLYFGARGSVKQYFQWEGFGKYYLAGYNRNDFSIGGKIKVSFYPISQGIHITGKIDVSQQRPAFFYNNYYSNHYVWENDFDKTTNTSVQGKMTIPTYGMEAFFGY